MPSVIKEVFTADAQRRAPIIELNLRDISQLFNSMDPSPFHDKDLDSDAEEFIVSWAREYPPDAPLTLRIHLEQWPAGDPAALIRDAVHNYFAYRARLNTLEYRSMMKQGRTSLLIGLIFLASCLLVIKMFLTNNEGPWTVIARESLTIAGWVSMWRPMEIYFYEWWPVKRRGRTYETLSRIPVEVIKATAPIGAK